MKKNKLLIPILGLATISGAIVPLVSCNKQGFDGHVTLQQWNDAFDLVCSPSKWNCTFTETSEIVTEGESRKSLSTDWFYSFAQIQHKNDAKANYYKKYDNCYYRIYPSSKGWTSSAIGDNILSFKNTPRAAYWQIVKNCYEKVTFDKELKAYKYVYSVSEDVKYAYVIFFNNKYQIEKMITTYYRDENNYEAITDEFRNMGTTAQIEFPFKDSEVEWHSATLHYDTDHYINESTVATRLHNSKFTVVNDFDLTKIEALSASEQLIDNPYVFHDIKIYVDGKIPTYKVEKSETQSFVTISGLSLKAGQQVQIVWNEIPLYNDFDTQIPQYIKVS